MIKSLAIVCAVVALFYTQNAQAQFVREQAVFVGPVVALNFQGSNSFYFGANVEYMMKRDVGLGLMFRYFTYIAREFPDGGRYGFDGGVIAADANYHFKVPQKELDPFVGAAIGLVFASGSLRGTSNTYGYKSPNTSDIMFSILVGARYFIGDKIAGVGRLAFGANYNALELGAEFSL